MKINYETESYCARCQEKRGKGLYCSICGNKMRNSTRLKNEQTKIRRRQVGKLIRQGISL